MAGLGNILKGIFEAEISKNFPSASKDIIRLSLDHFWDDIQSSCLNESSGSITSTTFLWIPKNVLGASVVPTLARAKWEHIDPGENILFLHLDPIHIESLSEEPSNDKMLRDLVSEKVRSVTVSCCGSESVVEDRVPLNLAKTMCYSTHGRNMYLELSKNATGACFNQDFCSTVEDFVNLSDLPTRSYLSGEKTFSDIRALIFDVLECFLKTIDCLGLCNWIMGNARKHDMSIHQELDSFMDKLEGFIFKLQSQAIPIQENLVFLGVLIHVVDTADEENVMVWRTSWLQILDEFRSVTGIFHGKRDQAFLRILIESMANMISKPIATYFKDHVGIFKESEQVHFQIAVSDEIKGGLQDIMVHMKEIFNARDFPVDVMKIQGAISILHDIMSRCRAVCEILRFKERYQSFLSLRNSVHGMDTVLMDTAEVFRQGISLKVNPYNTAQSRNVTVELQEIVVFLHRSETQMMLLLQNHLQLLSSFKRSLFLMSKFSQEEPEPRILEIQRFMSDIARDRGFSSIDYILETWVRHPNQIHKIRGMPLYASLLMRMKYFSALGNNLIAFNPTEEVEAIVRTLRDNVATSERAWMEIASRNVMRSYRMLQECITVKNMEGRTVTNFRKDLLLGLSELFWLKRLFPREAWSKQPFTTMYFQPITTFHEFQSLCKRIEGFMEIIGNHASSLLPILEQKLSDLDDMAISSISWSSASLDKFLQMLRERKEICKSLSLVVSLIKSEIEDMTVEMTGDDLLDLLCRSPWQWSELTEKIRETLHAYISRHIEASDRVVLKATHIIERWMRSNLTHVEVEQYAANYIAQYSNLLRDTVSRNLSSFYKRLFEIMFDILLGEETKHTSRLCEVSVEWNGEPDFISTCQYIGSCLHQIQDMSFTRLLQFRDLESIRKDRHATEAYLSKCLDGMKNRVIALDQAALCSEDFRTAAYSRLFDVLAHAPLETNGERNIQISSSIILTNAGSPQPPQSILKEHARGEVVRRRQDLETSILTAKNECLQLNQTIKSILNSETKQLITEIETIASLAREKLWNLEASLARIEYTNCMLERFYDTRNDEIEENTEFLAKLIDDTRLLLEPLHSKLYEAETEMLQSVQCLQRETFFSQKELEWVNNIDSYSLMNLDDRLRYLDVNLDETIEQALKGVAAVKELEYLSAKFRIDPGDFTLSRNAAPILQHVRDIIHPHRDLIISMEAFTSLSWFEGKERIAEYDEELSGHINRLQKLTESFSSWNMLQEYKSFATSSKEFIDLMMTLYSVDLKERHWKQLSFLTTRGTSLKLSDLWTDDILNQKPKIEEIISIAKRENQLKNSFDAVKSEWMAAKIHLITYKSSGEVFLEQSSTTDSMEKLEDTIMMLNNMISNRASSYFREGVKLFLKELANVEEGMQLWLSTQSVWSYLEAVFDGGDIAAQMPEESELFSEINVAYLNNVSKATRNPLLLELFKGDEIRDNFVHVLDELEKCQKSLTAYLESKRKLFPRFYFVSDSTLLEILSNGSDPRSVQKHFQSGLFDGIDHLLFESDNSNVATHIVSKEGEVVKLKAPLYISGPAEDWLTSLVEMMKDTMRFEARRAAKDVQKLTVNQFLFSRPAQMALLGIQIKWTADVQSALLQLHLGKKAALKKVLSAYEITLSNLVHLTLSSSLSGMERMSLETCITIFIHLKDVIVELINKRVEDPKSFDWLKHCRFRWREDKQTVMISICDNDFEYGYEYLGVKERLVMTSLTDICYVALTQAVGMNCGGAPAGPAGTGKTETTKDLGATLGKYVVVFNCGDQLDHLMMGRIFKGLAQAGFWGCFDEFNRIDLDVLSVCAQQLNCVFTALKERKKSFVFTDGDIIPINPDVGYFITMNPGYAGRQELPENLKALFRGVTMMAPDRRMIMKVKLAAAGFQDSEVISRKFDCLYTLCEQQLSKQPHYDFGLRNILSVLRTAGAAKRANPDVTEMTLMMKTLYDMNVSKFVSDDVSRFVGLINDVFPSIDKSNMHLNDFNTELQYICKNEGLQFHQDWAEKCVQLYQSSIVRHGIMVVGPPRSGKSTAIDTVAKTLTRMGLKTSIWKMNPKSITAPQMFGKLEAATGDWTDGIFSILWKKAARATHSVWIVVDGPVDAVWIENLNTVLDDNKVLTLANGDRIRMTSNMRLIFEAENLNNASPATVSRAGVVFMSPDALGWRPIFDSYALKINLTVNTQSFVTQLVEAALTALNSCDKTFDLGAAIMIESFIAYFEGLMNLNNDLVEILNNADGDAASEVLKNVLAFCIVWGFGGTLSSLGRVSFSQAIRRYFPSPHFFSETEAIHDYVYDIKVTDWVKWNIPGLACDISGSVDFASVAVHTLEETRCQYLMDMAIAAGKIPHVVGPQGSGKTTILKQYCQYKRQESYQSNMITFSSLTSPQMYQESFESYLEKRQGRNYGPASGKRMIFAMDDISMPRKNVWGDQVTNELMRQIFELKGFYRLDKPIGEFKNVNDVYYLTSSKIERDVQLPRRLWGVMCSIYIDHPTLDVTKQIINGMIEIYLSIDEVQEEETQVLRKIGNIVVSICQEVAEKAESTSKKTHYTFGHKESCTIMRSILSKLPGPELLRSNEMVQLCAHECMREIVDKLTSRSETQSMATVIQSLIVKNFPDATPINRLYFSSIFMDTENCGSECHYSPIRDFNCTKQAIEKALSRNRELSGSFVIFDEAIDHIIRITRVLEMGRRSMLLVGVGGSGKKSLARVAAAAAESKFFHSTRGGGYTVTNFFDDLRNAIRESGIKGNSVCFMLSDTDISDDILLDYVNQQLLNGRIAGLFQKEDMDSIITDIRSLFREHNSGKQENEENLLEFFWDRVSKYFHFVLCFSPSGEKLAKWLKQFPGILSCCTIDWFHSWPVEALISLSKNIVYPSIRDFSNTSPEGISNVTSRIHTLMSDLSENYHQDTGRQVHVTPKSYLIFLESLKSLYQLKAKAMQEYRESLGNGLQKMSEAKAQVDKMKDELREKQLVLTKSKKEIGELIEKVDVSTQEATVERQKVQDIVFKVTTKADEILRTKLEAENDLEKAKPALYSAVEALNSISPKDINSLKSLRKPPDVIKRIMDCVLILYHSPVSKISWHEVKENMVIQPSYEESVKMMNDMSFLQKLLAFPKDEINDETVELLQPYFRSADFNYMSAKKASGNVAGLCNWAEAMCKYHVVARDVEPKIIRLKESEKELSIAQEEQSRAEQQLGKLETTLERLNENLENARCEMNKIQKDAENTEMKMNNAVTLIESLGGEETRWQTLYQNNQSQLRSLLGDCLVACTFTSYLGSIGVSHRDLYLKKSQDICIECGVEVSERFQAVEFLSDGEQVSKWLKEGLPSDEFSIQNGVLLASSNTVPYIIDPQGQCTKWLQQKYPNSISIPLSSPKFDETLENSVARGIPLLIQNAELDFGTSLDSILENRGEGFVKIGEKEIEVGDGFTAILITRLSNPIISPEKFAKCTVLNFAVTFDGLEEQFLDFIVSRDESQLNQKRQSIDEDVRHCENNMKQLEIDLLKRLSSYEGDILEDTHLVSVLAETKSTAERVSSQLKEASTTKKTIAERCEEYRPCSKMAALLYFSLCDFSSLNHMYKTSLEQFKLWFRDSIDSAERSDNVSKRVQHVLMELKKTVYDRAQIGIFERDKDPFRFLLASKILQLEDDSGEVLEVLGALLSMGRTPVKAKRKTKDWLSEEQWRNILHLQQASATFFSNLSSSINSEESKWKAWIKCESPEISQSPLHSIQISSLLHLTLIRALRPEKSKLSMALYIENALGGDFLSSKAADLAEIASATDFKTPILCVISPGADPTSKIQEVARKKKIKCLNISMGQGQEVLARKYLRTAEQRGDWVCIQNAHLAGPYLKELEDHMDDLKKVDPNFRLWITTEPSDSFPLGLLHMAMRITCEPPSGLHDALVSLVSNFDNDVLDEVKMPQWKPLLLSLNVMHVLSQERKRFGAIGWVVPYEFSYTDLAASLNIVSNHLQTLRGRKSNSINWDSLHYLVGNIQYGGRIIDDRDQRLMLAYCKRFLSSDVLNGSISLLDAQKFPKVSHLYRIEVTNESTLEHMLQTIQKLPSHDMPQIFGLDASAEIASQILSAETRFDSICSIMRTSREGGKQDSKSRLTLERTIGNILSTVEQVLDNEKSPARYASASASPLALFFAGEDQILCSTSMTVMRDVSLVKDILDGHHGASDQSTKIMDSIEIGRVPAHWSAQYRWKTDSIDTWLKSLQLSQEHLTSSAQKYNCRCTWIPGISNPKAMLNGILQEHVRSSKDSNIKIDQLEIQYQVTKIQDAKSIKDAPKTGIYLYGCFVEGATWDPQSSKLTASKEPSNKAFPVIHAFPAMKSSAKKKKNIFLAPMYNSDDRSASAFIDYIPLPTDGDDVYWAQRGAALICKI